MVSNHGGRQLDGVSSTCEALPEVVDASAGSVPITVDGGIRRGTDVIRAIALGATAALIGRPYLWALAVDGEAGVDTMLEMLQREIEHLDGPARPALDRRGRLDRPRLTGRRSPRRVRGCRIAIPWPPRS